MAIDGENDRQPDGRFGRGDGHDEEHEHLPAHSEILRQRDEREIHRVEHELDAHEDHDRVAPHEHAEHAEREEHRGEGECEAEQH